MGVGGERQRQAIGQPYPRPRPCQPGQEEDHPERAPEGEFGVAAGVLREPDVVERQCHQRRGHMRRGPAGDPPGQRPGGDDRGEAEDQARQADRPDLLAPDLRGDLGLQVVQVVIVHRVAGQHPAPVEAQMLHHRHYLVEPQRRAEVPEPEPGRQREDQGKPEPVPCGWPGDGGRCDHGVGPSGAAVAGRPPRNRARRARAVRPPARRPSGRAFPRRCRK